MWPFLSWTANACNVGGRMINELHRSMISGTDSVCCGVDEGVAVIW